MPAVVQVKTTVIVLVGTLSIDGVELCPYPVCYVLICWKHGWTLLPKEVPKTMYVNHKKQLSMPNDSLQNDIYVPDNDKKGETSCRGGRSENDLHYESYLPVGD